MPRKRNLFEGVCVDVKGARDADERERERAKRKKNMKSGSMGERLAGNFPTG